MKRNKIILILSLAFVCTCSAEDSYYNPYFPYLGKKTKEQWEELGRKNWESVTCMNDSKNQEAARTGTKTTDDYLAKLYEICGVKQVSRVGN